MAIDKKFSSQKLKSDSEIKFYNRDYLWMGALNIWLPVLLEWVEAKTSNFLAARLIWFRETEYEEKKSSNIL